MNETISVTTERVDDIPVLLAQIARLNIGGLIDECCPVHGNWQGVSLGQVAQVWLAHILSRGDHRLNQVQAWATQRLQTLRSGVDPALTVLDFTDDRLAQVLNYLSDDASWQSLEAALTARTLRVYDLTPERVRLDTTTASGYWEVTAEGLFQFGPSKDHRPDLPQVKVMVAALDPLGVPCVTQVLSGQRADDPLYVPAIKQVRQGLQRSGLLYIGDAKMGAQETRAFVVAGGDYYLLPLAQTQVSPAVLTTYLEPVWRGEQPLEQVYRTAADGQQTLLATGFEITVEMDVVLAARSLQWVERRLIVRSEAQATAQQAQLETRLTKAMARLATLNQHGRGRKRYTECAPVEARVAKILQQYHVTGLLQVACYLGEITTATGSVKPKVLVRVTRDEAAIHQAQDLLGWHVYATNYPRTQLSLADAVHAYRAEYLVEHNFARLKGHPLLLRPMYLADEHRVTGLIRLLSLGLRVLTTLEFGVRRRLAQQGTPVAGLYAGNPARTTSRPTAERLLTAFTEITLSIITVGDHVYYHLTALSDLQQHLLTLLDFPHNLYADVLTGLPPNPI